ncbi:glycosyltransferase family 4 protein [Roseobacter sp. WL0113]|uniref:Glycosyltransferase family 4 protein n=2 Tax=Roseobacter sinensis TaxID=2931391 RepID=A0ABT3BIE2_9RHOB|nr:glycosyltransferase family 4 protein [Roseobacter sp. WL0113]
MLRAFLARGAEVTLISPRMDEAPPEDLQNVIRQPLPRPEGAPDARATQQISLNRQVTQALEALGPFDLIYERHALFACAAMDYARTRQIPSVLEVNAPLIDEQTRHRSLARLDDAILLACRSFVSASHIVAVSPEVAAYAEGLGADVARIQVEPNAVNPARFPEAARFEGPFRVGFLGTLKPWHDVALILEAFALLRQGVSDAELLIVGDGPERSNLMRQAEATGVSAAVRFTGAVPPEEVPDWLARMHVGLATYRGDDPFYFSPLKLYEYMAAGIPSVVSQVGNLVEAINEGQTGVSVPPDCAEALAEALGQLARNPDLVRRMGHEARHRVLTTQTWDHVAERVLLRTGLDLKPAKGAA